jgi:hypothetical protein
VTIVKYELSIQNNLPLFKFFTSGAIYSDFSLYELHQNRLWWIMMCYLKLFKKLTRNACVDKKAGVFIWSFKGTLSLRNLFWCILRNATINLHWSINISTWQYSRFPVMPADHIPEVLVSRLRRKWNQKKIHHCSLTDQL